MLILTVALPGVIMTLFYRQGPCPPPPHQGLERKTKILIVARLVSIGTSRIQAELRVQGLNSFY